MLALKYAKYLLLWNFVSIECEILEGTTMPMLLDNNESKDTKFHNC